MSSRFSLFYSLFFSRLTSLFSFFSLVFLLVLSLAQHSFAQDDAMTDADTSAEESMAEVSDMSDDAQTAAAEMVSARYFCELQGLTRRIEIDYETSDSSVPCSVNYYKDTEAPGEVNTLWTATNIEGYCEQKAAGFIDKLKSWGWSCREG